MIYAGTWHLPWKTTDGGEHWDNIEERHHRRLRCFLDHRRSASPQIVYASACSGIYKSDDAGQTVSKAGRASRQQRAAPPSAAGSRITSTRSLPERRRGCGAPTMRAGSGLAPPGRRSSSTTSGRSSDTRAMCSSPPIAAVCCPPTTAETPSTASNAGFSHAPDYSDEARRPAPCNALRWRGERQGVGRRVRERERAALAWQQRARACRDVMSSRWARPRMAP